MSYLALQNAWTSVIQPPTGVLGVGLNATMTTLQKISAVNNWTVAGTVPATITISGSQILNCINYPEFVAITTASLQTQIMALCAVPSILGGSANTTHMGPGLLLAAFTTGSQTIAALTVLASAQPWWSTPSASGGGGFSSPVSLVDTSVAGLS